MIKFAKLFESGEYGQILIKLDDGENGPEVRTYIGSPVDEVHLISAAMEFPWSKEGWKAAEKAFNAIDFSKACQLADTLREAWVIVERRARAPEEGPKAFESIEREGMR